MILNGRSINKSKMSVKILETEFKEYLTAIDYSMEQPVEYNYNLLGQPASFGKGNVSATGTLSFIDAGVQKLNALAVANGFESYLDLGSVLDLNITVEYEDGAGIVYTDLLNGVHFTNYTRGMNGTDTTFSRDLNITVGKILLDYKG